jgi:hypothetical protein
MYARSWHHPAIDFRELHSLSKHDPCALCNEYRYLDFEHCVTGPIREGTHHFPGVPLETDVLNSLRRMETAVYILLYPDKACAIAVKRGVLLFVDSHNNTHVHPTDVRSRRVKVCISCKLHAN